MASKSSLRKWARTKVGQNRRNTIETVSELIQNALANTQRAYDRSTQKNLPDQIVDLFLALVFIGDLKGGDRLPPELELTKILRVNQSSLRMAMRVLARMNVVESTRGSGLVVLDYKKQTGLDFMSELVRIPELNLGSGFLLQMLEGAPILLLQLMKSVTEKEMAEDHFLFPSVMDLQKKYLEEGAPPRKIADLDILIQNVASAELLNPVLRASFNSFVPLRTYMMEMYYSMGGERLIRHVENQKTMWVQFVNKEISRDEFLEKYFIHVSAETNALSEYLKTLPQAPELKTSPLQHYPEMVSLAETR